MFIVMHCMGMSFDGNTIETRSLGGSETAAYYMAKELAAKGHEVSLFTNTENEGVYDGVRYVSCGRPTEHAPLGERFHFYATNTPIDVLIIQRHPQAFSFPYSAKIKLWWVHDLAISRQQPQVQSMLWNVDGILTVSEFHKKQYAEVYGINPDIIYPIQNGVDLSLFNTNLDIGNPEADAYQLQVPPDQFAMLYTSRPERGLDHLVAPNGIMERLLTEKPEAHLYVCGYENTTEQMRKYYEHLWGRCDELPNVTNLGSLTKGELADVMRQCDLLVYPTPGPLQPNFEEVSCITAMETMAAGLPFLSSSKGALPETCKDSGSSLLPLAKDGLPEIKRFVQKIKNFADHPEKMKAFREKQLEAASRYEWSVAAGMLLGHIDTCFSKNRSNGAIMRDLIENSDIYALQNFVEGSPVSSEDLISQAAIQEMHDCYDFALNEEPYFEEHYKAVYTREKEERGVNYGPENLQGNDRFESVANIISNLGPDSVVLDYGCAHGHYTINLAKRFPDRKFVGIDITRSNVDIARKWAEDEGVDNVEFVHGRVKEGEIILLSQEIGNIALKNGFGDYDAVIAAEVIEHVDTPRLHVDTLCKYLKPSGKMIITVPFGPWEAQGYEENWPWRAHLWHFEREDLQELWGHMDNYTIMVIPAGRGKEGTIVGSYVLSFDRTDNFTTGSINYERKFASLKPRQTVSLCMIVKDAEDTLKRSLDSVSNVVDEIIIAIDETTTDATRDVINKFKKDRKGLWPAIRTFEIKSPLEIGFDEARNLSIAAANGDWIMWLDSDEIVVKPENILKYLHNNQFSGYAIKQHHFAVEPLGVLKTDLPCRLFRNHEGIKFFGVIHEHPEKDLNEGVGHVQLLHDVEIAHQGYTTEEIRRKRFNRNIGLMIRDRKKYPKRNLGKFLWIRDLAQLNRYELEMNGNQVTLEMRRRAEEGIKLWEELLRDNQTRMLVDSLDYYSMLTQIMGVGFEAGFSIETSKANGGVHMERAPIIQGHFASKEHLEKLMDKLLADKTRTYDSKYF